MSPQSDYEAVLDWWMTRANDAAERTIPKAIEYGSGDLAEIGRAMARMGGMSVRGTEAETELGILFYLVGKIARWEQAVHDGRQVSDDTLFDVMVYAMMALRVRDVGGWPWAPGDRTGAAGLESMVVELAQTDLCGHRSSGGHICTHPAGHYIGGEATRHGIAKLGVFWDA